MGRPLQRSDCDDHERISRSRNEVCSQNLLDALKANHEPQPEKIAEAVVLPPIPNSDIARAAEIAFPRLILNRIEAIQRATLTEFPTITLFDIRSQRRTAKIVHARQLAMFIAKKLTSQSFPEIGRRFGGRDHTTVMHAVRKIEKLVSENPDLAATVERIKEVIPEPIWA